YVYLAVWFAALITPFFFAGMIIADLLGSYPRRSSRLYGTDLIGAAVGVLLLVPLIPALKAEGLVVFSAILACAAGLAYVFKKSGGERALLACAIVGLLALLPFADRVMPIKLHQTKRLFNKAVAENRIIGTRWSTISRVDFAEHHPAYRAVWIDGGTNESVVLKAPESAEQIYGLVKNKWKSIGTIHTLKRESAPNTLIIGSSGGKEVWLSLFNNARHIDAVEMDPSIVRFVGDPQYAEYMGGLFQNPRVSLIEDEGRSFLSRQPENYYDIIQFVNNYTPIAMAAGALNLSSTFLLTKEAIKEYYNHLTPDGIFAAHRGTTLRVALTALEALRELGIQEPEKHIVITNGEFEFLQGFYMKKTPFTKEEEQGIQQFMSDVPRTGGFTFLWTPFDPVRNTIYAKVLSSPPEEQKKYYHALGVNLSPATDDKPFLEHFVKYGKVKIHPLAPSEFFSRSKEKWNGIIPRGDFPYAVILAESALLGLLFIGVPLVLRARSAVRTQGFFGMLGYFAALGFGFIVVEICLMKRYVLFLGNPAYSITTILIALLLGAGLGSMASDMIPERSTRRALPYVVLGIGALLLVETFVSPLVFQACLGFEFLGRIAVAAALLMPLGFVMGMPFPLGMRLINSVSQSEAERKKLIAWGWGMNGYATVVGSAATVFMALFAGFQAVLFGAIIVYALGGLAMMRATRA
ncbi:MAG TPA: hypothetical protein PLP17_06590, partial [Oligoflexia bacterium]|nr:hypothetical protein [Oligoflexia bacterium]